MKLNQEKNIIKSHNDIINMSRDALLEVHCEIQIGYHAVKGGFLTAVELIGEQSEKKDSPSEENSNLKKWFTKDQRVIEQSKNFATII